MKHLWSILCSKSIIDANTNSISIMDCLEELRINVPEDKKNDKLLLPIEYEIVSFWLNENNNKDNNFFLKIDLYDPNEKKLGEFVNLFTFPKDKKRLRTRIITKGLPFTKEGIYTFVVMLKEKRNKPYTEIISLPLDVYINK